MIRVRDLAELPSSLRGGVVAIGNFDGVHRGHQAVLERALAEARQLGAPCLVLTFEPHPRMVFRPDRPLFRLTPAPLKARVLAALGMDGVVEQHFDIGFASLDPAAFVQQVLVDGLVVRHALTGFDFHFGHNREGGPAFLMACGSRAGFGVTLIDAFRDEGAEVISSTRIRDLLACGDPAQAAGLLGYRFIVQGEVVRGNQLGRTLGYPTANMAVPDGFDLKEGIYAVRLRRADGTLLDGVASFGRRPTVEAAGVPLLETHVFDFAGDLYGETVSVSVFGYLRGETKFDDLDALTRQMRCDETEARALLSGVRPLSDLDATLNFA